MAEDAIFKAPWRRLARIGVANESATAMTPMRSLFSLLFAFSAALFALAPRAANASSSTLSRLSLQGAAREPAARESATTGTASTAAAADASFIEPQPVWPASALSTDDPRARYRLVEDCMSFRRFDRLFKAEASNPAYPLNNPEALGRLPPAQRRLLADRVALVASKRSDCADWAASVNEATAGATAYLAALDAASAGDVRAGTCYAMGLWPSPVRSRSPSPTGLAAPDAPFAATYRSNVRRLLAAAMTAGYWPAVIVADNIARAEHGPRTRIRYEQREAYVFKRLLESGIGDPALEEAYRFEAERLAQTLGEAELERADAEVAMRLRKAFGGKPMTEAERYENCGN